MKFIIKSYGMIITSMSVCQYSTDQSQPNTKADPESEPEVPFGSALSPLFKNVRPLWVRSESALSPLEVRSASALGEGSALRTHAWSVPRSVVPAYKPRPLYIPNTLSSQFIM